MKKRIVFCMFGAFLAVTLVLTGCPTEASSSSPASGNLGENELELKGDVYTQGSDLKYTKVAADHTVTSNLNGTGSITGGKLSFKIPQPAATQLTQPITDFTTGLSAQYDTVTLTPAASTAKYATLRLRAGTDDLVNENYSQSISGTSATLTTEDNTYIYLSEDVTIKGKGKSFPSYAGTMKSSDINMSLKKGWNIIYTKEEIKTSTSESSATFTMKDEKHSLKWVIE
ncbi:MAG: hypothetical protein LBK62_03550 [Treponema sp.]|jgi:hypothetical protein|nr:hypothetical protein [Treponema sp.]